MPTLTLTTNVPGNGVDTSDAIKELSKTVASSVGKPEAYVMVSLQTDRAMCFAGTEAPCCFGELFSIGAIGGAKNKKIAAALSEVLQARLGVPPGRFYLKFSDCAASDFGYNGTTFG